MIKMVIFDIDGTLYSRQKRQILDSTLSAMKKLKEQGIKIVVATGRSFTEISKGVLSEYYDYLVSSNGHRLMDNKGNVLFAEYFTNEETQALVDFCNEHSLALILKMDDACYLYANHPAFKIESWGSDGIETYYSGQEEHHLTHPVNCAFVKCAPEYKEEFQKHCPAIRFVHTGVDSYDVYYSSLNKAVTLEKLLKHLGLDWQECMAVGDGTNDIEMVLQAGVGVAMGDGHERLKEVADYVTDTSNDDGIFKAMQAYQLI